MKTSPSAFALQSCPEEEIDERVTEMLEIVKPQGL